MKDRLKQTLKKRKRMVTVISAIAAALLVLFITWLVFVKFYSYSKDPEDFKVFINSYGYAGMFVAVGIQMLQVVIALLPGEFVEIGIGYAYGALGGTILCLLGTALASTLIFLLTKKWGLRLVELFTDPQKINRLKFINNEKRLKKLVFILYLLPGTPKDLLTYFAGLTKLTLSEFLTISTIARIPTVVTSTLGGHLLGDGNYVKAGIIFALTAAISLLGIKLYSIIINHKHKKGNN